MTRLALLLSVTAGLSLASCSRDSGLEDRVKKLEGEVERLHEVEAFIRPFMDKQKAQDAQEAAREPDPTAVFAVNIEGDQYDGPADAAVTIVEAFDFA